MNGRRRKWDDGGGCGGDGRADGPVCSSRHQSEAEGLGQEVEAALCVSAVLWVPTRARHDRHTHALLLLHLVLAGRPKPTVKGTLHQSPAQKSPECRLRANLSPNNLNLHPNPNRNIWREPTNTNAKEHPHTQAHRTPRIHQQPLYEAITRFLGGMQSNNNWCCLENRCLERRVSFFFSLSFSSKSHSFRFWTSTRCRKH